MPKFFNFLKYFAPFSLVLLLAQYGVVTTLFKEIPFFYSTMSVYVFHMIITILSCLLLLFVNKKFPVYTGYAFMGISVVKMMASLVFLIPLIQSDLNDRIPDVAAFFVPYFLFLFFEAFFAIRLINKT